MITKDTRTESYIKRPTPRVRDILNALGDKEMTARQLAYTLGYSERNATAPRLTEMKEAGIIEVSGKAYDQTTRRWVATYRKCVKAEAKDAQIKLPIEL